MFTWILKKVFLGAKTISFFSSFLLRLTFGHLKTITVLKMLFNVLKNG